MARARTLLSAVMVVVSLGVAIALTFAYPNPNVAKFLGWSLLFLAVQAPVVIVAIGGRDGRAIRIADRDSM